MLPSTTVELSAFVRDGSAGVGSLEDRTIAVIANNRTRFLERLSSFTVYVIVP